MTGEEREPTDGEEDDDNDQHTDDVLLLAETVLLDVSRPGGLPDRRSSPEGVQDAPVGDGHDEDGSQVDGQIEEERVGEVQTMIWEVFDADLDNLEGQLTRRGILTDVQNGFDSLEDDLGGHEGEGENPEYGDED